MKWIIASLLVIAVTGDWPGEWLEMTPEDQAVGVHLTLYNNDHKMGLPIFPAFPKQWTQEQVNAVFANLWAKPMKIVVHGYYSRAEKWKKKGQDITENFLKKEDVNVILVDWSTLATGAHANQAKNNLKKIGLPTYIPASRFAMDVGGVLADWLLANICHYNPNIDLHLIGHSLGAQAVGKAGRIMSDPRRFGRDTDPCTPRRVTGLDPAGPRFEFDNRNKWGVSSVLEMIGKDSGRFVDIIHTNAGVMGGKQPLGDVDFYVNGGRRWQKCAGRSQLVHPLRDYNSHGHSKTIFINSILDKEDQKYLSPVCLNFNARLDTNYNAICWGADTRYSNWVGYGARAIRQGSWNDHIALLTDEKVTMPCPVNDAELDEAVWSQLQY